MSSKGKKDPDYHVGSLVFAKLKGFAPWPAKIVKAEKKKYYVYFYGTGEKSPAMKSEDLFDYAKHKEKYVVDKNLKRKGYPEAVEQIEAALRGEEDVASIYNTSASLEPFSESNAAETTDMLDESEIVEPAAAAATNTTTTTDPEPEATDKNETTPPEIAENVPETVVPAPESDKKKKPVTKAAKPETKIDAKPEVEATPEPEIVSRSGRKIKTKRYLIDELEETVTPTIKKRAVDSIDSRKDSSSDATPPPAKKQAKPVPVPVQMPKEKPNPVKDALLQIESHMVELDHLIKMSLGLKNANADKCLAHLEEYAKIQITPLMLKKRPSCVHTMKRLRKYVGNVNNWNMDPEKRNEFHEKTLKIQSKANEIYSNFKLLFPTADTTKPFFEHFSEKVAEFQEKTKGMKPEEISDMYEEPVTPPTSPTTVHENNGSTPAE
ncbi:PC4 and SFRS1-interacting protein [Culicoides brevitarsis]|uniref:PC4 and SFRS1-interacting protein n=1 Tax=Culicoides brevitarsis TaxID=469753 RepID=UPI00307BAE63